MCDSQKSPAWDINAAKLIHVGLASMAGALIPYMMITTDVATSVKSSFDFTILISYLGFLLGIVALLMQIRLTSKTNQIAEQAKEDEIRRNQLETLMKVKTDVNRLRHTVANFTRATGGSGSAKRSQFEKEASDIDEAIYQLEGNDMQLDLIFGDRASQLRHHVSELANDVYTWLNGGILENKPAFEHLPSYVHVISGVRQIDKHIRAIWHNETIDPDEESKQSAKECVQSLNQ
jgi:isoleucyl-tRNA synthetase